MTEPRRRFRDLLAAEWIKLRSLRSTAGSLLVVFCATIVFCLYASLADHRNWPTYDEARRTLFNPLRDAFPEQAYLFVILAAGAVGATMVASEYSTGLIRTTFTAVPARREMAAAKIVVVAVVMFVVGVAAALLSFAVSQTILSTRDANYFAITDPVALRAIGASAVLVPMSAVIGMGIGALVRHTAATIVTTTALLLLLPTAFTGITRRWQWDIYNALPLAAWRRLVEVPGHDAMLHPYTASVTESWVVLAAWPLVAVIVALVAVTWRDV
jgi:ABC-type transport system involved in multi-copper enzyme maturation permease subunit